MMNNVAGQKLHIDRFADNHIKGSFEGKANDQALLLTLPYNEGWRAKINGKKVNLEPVLDRSMMVIKEIPQGEN
ncbi:YfhO family protein, partial [Pauljensenia sp. UMB0018B]|nr:YfhO family protein [Pauljensenia sp. UMB0018B]